MMNPDIFYKEEVDVLLEEVAERQIVLYNDDVNTFDHVIDVLVKHCKHELTQAEQCAVLVHYTGRCSVKQGSYDDLKPICEALLENDLTAEIE